LGSGDDRRLRESTQELLDLTNLFTLRELVEFRYSLTETRERITEAHTPEEAYTAWRAYLTDLQNARDRGEESPEWTLDIPLWTELYLQIEPLLRDGIDAGAFFDVSGRDWLLAIDLWVLLSFSVGLPR